MIGSDKWEGFRKDDPPAGITAEELPGYLREHGDEFLGARPFAAYMRAKFREKGVLQQNVFLAADLSENYGYKLIAEEKHTVGRDTILRVCLAARFDADETREALLLYGMAPLYGASPRSEAGCTTSMPSASFWSAAGRRRCRACRDERRDSHRIGGNGAPAAAV